MDFKVIHVRGHVFDRLRDRFGISDFKAQKDFLVSALEAVKVRVEHNFLIAIVNEDAGISFKAQFYEAKKILVLMTCYDLSNDSYYIIREKLQWRDIKTKKLTNVPIIFKDQDIRK